ncbi:hypothetical protein BX611_1837 [Lutibacter oceani]|uniref:DUF5777 domain-containing protein n=1 Tax=Lutibacter oceani TaxID=1853311 RepID=A0A3D9RQU7_9FLAO|nr:DUF5777 family beta-barrel protein [Lutibacter oceani]REE82290.1 hypothetical protein BX611_1837 [Lutibacter oceani]
MKNYKIILFVLFILPFVTFAQEDEKKDEKVKEKVERPAFESSFIVDNPTNVLFSKNSLEVTMQHRFGTINGGTNDMAGFWAPSNIRIGLTYAIHERLTIGYGTTKFNRLQDFNWKVALLRQTRSGSMPFSVSYYGNFTIDARSKENFNMIQDRYSYFNQLIIAKRFSPNVSLQIAPSVSHYNLVDGDTMKNDMVAVSFGGRFKVSPQTSILLDYSQPITKFESDPKPGVSIGAEFATSAHAFQIFLTNYNGLVSQKNYMYNQNDFFNGDFLIGFNITRIYNF